MWSLKQNGINLSHRKRVKTVFNAWKMFQGEERTSPNLNSTGKRAVHTSRVTEAVKKRVKRILRRRMITMAKHLDISVKRIVNMYLRLKTTLDSRTAAALRCHQANIP